MPGIFTHNFIFKRVVDNVQTNRGRSHIMRSLEILFADKEHLRAGLFGSIGPDIFDYMKICNRDGIYGNDISFYLHDAGCASFVRQMVDAVIGQKDCRNEWASIQKAYLLGYIAHVAADAVINPFVFYFSGFPSDFSRKEIIRYRIANLRFQYNIDNYYLYKSEFSALYNFSVDEMLPEPRKNVSGTIWPQVMVLLLESLKREKPDLFERFFPSLAGVHIDGDIGRIRLFDRIPVNIRLSYKLRRASSERITGILDRLRDNPLTFSDFFIRYPVPKAVDLDALNMHQARWQYPALQRGYRYESVPVLVKGVVEEITDIWEKVEEAVLNRKVSGDGVIFPLNAYSGEKDAMYSDMKIKDMIKLKI